MTSPLEVILGQLRVLKGNEVEPTVKNCKRAATGGIDDEKNLPRGWDGVWFRPFPWHRASLEI